MAITLKGVGRLMTTVTDANGNANLVMLGDLLEEAKFDMKVDIGEIAGGDQATPYDVFLTKKDVTITITNHRFDLNTLSMIQGTSVSVAQATQPVWVFDEPVITVPTGTTTTTVALSYKSTYYAQSKPVAYYTTNNQPLTPTASAATAPTQAGQVQFDGTGNAIFYVGASGDQGKNIQVVYQRTISADTLVLDATSEPMYVQFAWQGKWKQKGDGLIHGFDMNLYKCFAYGDFQLTGKTRAHNTNAIQLKALVDPNRADGAIGHIRMF